MGDEDEWLLSFSSLKQLRPWKSDESFLSRFQRVKSDNKLLLIENILESVKKTEYVQAPAFDFNGLNVIEEQQSYAITRKKILIDDVDFFFSKFRDAVQTYGVPQRREDDLMVHFCSIDDELMNSPDEQLCKLLSYTFMVIAQLIKAM